MDGYTRIKLNDELFETKVINGDLYIPHLFPGISDDNKSVIYLKIKSSTIKQLINSANNKVKRSSKRAY